MTSPTDKGSEEIAAWQAMKECDYCNQAGPFSSCVHYLEFIKAVAAPHDKPREPIDAPSSRRNALGGTPRIDAALTPAIIERMRDAGKAGYLDHGGAAWEMLCDLAQKGLTHSAVTFTGPFTVGEPEDEDGSSTVLNAAGESLTADQIVAELNARSAASHNLRLLCEVIAESAQRMGIYNGEAPLDGPHFVMLLADMTNAFCTRSATALTRVPPISCKAFSFRITVDGPSWTCDCGATSISPECRRTAPSDRSVQE